MSHIENEIKNFNFINIVPSNGIKKRCVDICKRIRNEYKQCKISFFIEKQPKGYNAFGVVKDNDETYVFSSSGVHLFSVLLNVESGLRNQISHVTSVNTKFKYAI